MDFNAALSGIQAASTQLGVIGNNVANASTVGFKNSRAEFSDVYAVSGVGVGSNAIGSGTQLAAVNQNFSQGTVSFTNNALDIAVNGEGFFVLDNNGSRSYTRAGNFEVDRGGYIVNNSGQNLVGLISDANGNITGEVGTLQILSGNIAPQASSAVSVGVNLYSNETPPAVAWVGGSSPPSNTYTSVTSTTLFDSLGNEHVMSLYFIKDATNNEWDVRIQVDNADVALTASQLLFNTNGTYKQTTPSPITASFNPTAADPMTITLDLSQSTQFGSPFAVESLLQDGFSTGRLDSVDVDNSGVILGIYTNGESRAMGQVQLANFNNTNGLQPIGNSSWAETFGSGPPLVSTPGTASLGVLQSSSQEESNVDLTSELVSLITAQRNFQANAQTIRTADTVIQTIINLR